MRPTRHKGSLRWLVLLGVMILSVLFMDVSAHAAIIEVDETSTNFSQGNKLTLLREPDIQEFTVTTNIPNSRLTWDTSRDKYHNFQQHYDHKYLIIDKVQPRDEVYVYYKNAGLYDGRPIDLRMTFSNMNYKKRSLYDANKTYLHISESPFSGYVFYNMSHGNVTYSFYDGETGDILDIDGNSFLTFNSLNGYNDSEGRSNGEFYNYLNYDTGKANSVVDAYIIKNSNVQRRVNPHMPYKGAIYVGVSNDFQDKLGSPTFTRNSVSFQIKGKHHKFVFGSGRNSAWQTPSSAVLFNVTAPDPTKTVLNESGDDINNGMVYGGENITYRIGQRVHVLGQDIMEKYTSMTITDELPSDVEYKNARFVDARGDEITNAGTIRYNQETHTVTFTASASFLADDMEYIGETYYLDIDVSVKDIHNGADGRGKTITNEATARVNKVAKDSNVAKVTIVPHLAEIGLKKVQIYTNKASSGLPSVVELDSRLISARNNEEALRDSIVTLRVVNTTTGDTVFSEDISLLELDDLTWEDVLPATNLEKDSVYRYTYQLTHKEGRGLLVKNDIIELDGYTAQEKTITIPEDRSSYYRYTGVAMTEREIGRDMRTYDERLTLDYRKVQRVKSGYAFDLHVGATYENDVMQEAESRVGFSRSVDMTTMIDHRLLDRTMGYLEDGVTYQDGDMVEIAASRTTDATDIRTTTTYRAPKTYLEQSSGMMFTEEQKNNGEMDGEIIDAGNRLYVPVWDIELGSYAMSFSSDEPIGSNHTHFELDSTVEVIAYMFHHIDSPSTELDELLLTPIRPEDIPEDW